MEMLLAEGYIAHKFAVRLQTLVNRAKGRSANDIAAILGININTVSDHVNRCLSGGVDARLRDKSRKPGTVPIPEERKDKLTRLVFQEKPQDGTRDTEGTRSKAA